MPEFIVILFSITLSTLQVTSQQYSPHVVSVLDHMHKTEVALSLFIATFAHSFLLVIFILRIHFGDTTFVFLLIQQILG